MYVTIFDTLIPRWHNLSVHARALVVGVSIIAVNILSQFLAPKIQSLVTGFLGGSLQGILECSRPG